MGTTDGDLHSICNIVIIGFFIIALVILFQSIFKESFSRFGDNLSNACEFNRECLFDNARTIGLSNGMEGVCTTHGLACPSFMLSQNQYFGNDSSITPEEYKQFLSANF
jgi:hypothetical protein